MEIVYWIAAAVAGFVAITTAFGALMLINQAPKVSRRDREEGSMLTQVSVGSGLSAVAVIAGMFTSAWISVAGAAGLLLFALWLNGSQGARYRTPTSQSPASAAAVPMICLISTVVMVIAS